MSMGKSIASVFGVRQIAIYKNIVQKRTYSNSIYIIIPNFHKTNVIFLVVIPSL